ncbi:hypothetical protein U1Q18_014985 [Sarracenia purpurea var. burkii]
MGYVPKDMATKSTSDVASKDKASAELGSTDTNENGISAVAEVPLLSRTGYVPKDMATKSTSGVAAKDKASTELGSTDTNVNGISVVAEVPLLSRYKSLCARDKG